MNKLGQYYYDIVPGHPRANKDGAVYYHVLQAEKKLGRYLLPEEVVHHIDENKLNNNLDNLIVFANGRYHTYFHKKHLTLDDLIQLDNGSYITSTEPNTSICPICGNKKDKKSAMCLECRNRQRQDESKSNSIDKEKLHKLLMDAKGNFTYIASLFNVSDNTIRKWCAKYNLPTHTIDYKNGDGYSPIYQTRQAIDIDELIQLYNQGFSIQEIAKTTKHDATTIANKLKENNITTTEELRQRTRIKQSKACRCLDKNGNFVKTFSSLTEAEQWLNKPRSSQHIKEVCNGSRKTAYNYKWEYL